MYLILQMALTTTLSLDLSTVAMQIQIQARTNSEYLSKIIQNVQIIFIYVLFLLQERENCFQFLISFKPLDIKL